MFKIYVYDIDNKYTYMSDMMANNKPVFSYEFETPKNEKEFENIVEAIKHEGFLYELFLNNKIYAEGIVTADSLYDDLMS